MTTLYFFRNANNRDPQEIRQRLKVNKILSAAA